ncbi:FxsA family membrane protein [Streptomyces sp. NPDC049837]|uniref:FxsA family membrane protein n=1 Tax=Streptomyces sp. NPDC049837 TaxID=3155277 RepID=UPI00342224AD
MMNGAPPPLARKPRSRARNLVPLGIAAWLVLEIWLLTLVAAEAGGLAVLALLVGGGVLGAAVIKRAGRQAFRTLTETLQQQQEAGPGAGPAADRASTGNGFLMLGGLLLMLPGLISDAVGLLLLVPRVRTMAGRYAEKALERRVRAVVPGYGIHRPDGKVVQGEVIHPDTPHNDETPRPPLPH